MAPKLFFLLVDLMDGWQSLDKYERSAIADVLEAEYFDAGKVIIIEGTPGDKFYFLEEVSSNPHHPQALEKFPNVFGVHLTSVRISLRKGEEGSTPTMVPQA